MKYAYKYHFSIWDALVISSALQGECSILYSEDMQHNQIIKNSLTILNPFKIYQEKNLQKNLLKLKFYTDALVYALTDKRIVNSIDLGKLRKTSISIEYDKIQEIIVDTNIFFDFLFGCSLVKLNTSSTIVSKETGIYLSQDDADDFKRKVETLKQKK